MNILFHCFRFASNFELHLWIAHDWMLIDPSKWSLKIIALNRGFSSFWQKSLLKPSVNHGFCQMSFCITKTEMKCVHNAQTFDAYYIKMLLFKMSTRIISTFSLSFSDLQDLKRMCSEKIHEMQTKEKNDKNSGSGNAYFTEWKKN